MEKIQTACGSYDVRTIFNTDIRLRKIILRVKYPIEENIIKDSRHTILCNIVQNMSARQNMSKRNSQTCDTERH